MYISDIYMYICIYVYIYIYIRCHRHRIPAYTVSNHRKFIIFDGFRCFLVLILVLLLVLFWCFFDAFLVASWPLFTLGA